MNTALANIQGELVIPATIPTTGFLSEHMSPVPSR